MARGPGAPRPAKLAGIEARPRREKQKQRPGNGAPSLETAMKAVKTLSRLPPGPEHFERYREEAEETKNDRGAAILHATNLENTLESALASYLSIARSRQEEIFGFNGPLGTFSDKISMAQAIGIIGPVSRSNFDIIRVVRNAFAHTMRPISFSDEQISALCSFLKVPMGVSIGKRIYTPPEYTGSITAIRHVFQVTCSGMQLHLLRYTANPAMKIAMGGLTDQARESVIDSLSDDAEIVARLPSLP